MQEVQQVVIYNSVDSGGGEEEEEGFGGGGVTHSPRMPLSRSQLTLGPPDCTHTLRIMFGAVSGRGG